MIGVLWATGVGTILYWIAFFSTGEVRASAAPCYLAFEHAFPAADGWMAIACLAAAEGLRRNREWALLWGIAAGSAVVFLGCMDVLYDLENDLEESYDMAPEQPKVVAEIQSRIELLMKTFPADIQDDYEKTKAKATIPYSPGALPRRARPETVWRRAAMRLPPFGT